MARLRLVFWRPSRAISASRSDAAVVFGDVFLVGMSNFMGSLPVGCTLPYARDMPLEKALSPRDYSGHLRPVTEK